MPDELRLALFALHQQATVGPCTEAKPWGWNVVESAKWESWNQLGNMSSVEAMRLYVKLIEEEQVRLFIGQMPDGNGRRLVNSRTSAQTRF